MKFKVEYISEFGGRMSTVVDAPSWDEVGVCARDEVPGIYDIEDITEVKEVK